MTSMLTLIAAAALLQQPWTAIQITAGQLLIYTVHTAYALAAPGEPFAIAGSSDLVELSVNEGSAADLADAEIGDTVELVLARPDEA